MNVVLYVLATSGFCGQGTILLTARVELSPDALDLHRRTLLLTRSSAFSWVGSPAACVLDDFLKLVDANDNGDGEAFLSMH